MGLYQLFKQQAVRNPDATAIVYGNEKLTYRELNNRVDAFARIVTANAPDSVLLGVSASRSVHTIISILTLLKSGKGYLPLDASYPADRLRQIITDSGIDICLAEATEYSLFTDLGLNTLSEQSVPAPVNTTTPKTTKIAYVLYTSGSTGKPKGVCMGADALLNLLQWQEKYSKSAPGFNTLQYAPLTFDVSFQEIFSTLTTGGTLFLIPDEIRLDPTELLKFIETRQINRIFLPFVALQYLAEAAGSSPFASASLKEVITAGEQLKVTPQMAQFFIALPQCKLFNQYGPTESHVVTQLELSGNPRSWPPLPNIGEPIDNAEILILDEQLQPVKDGESGELYISGVCLADGYLNRSDLTAERFITWQHNGETKRIYKSGDIARILPDKNIEYQGRTDTQVKIRGNRVEPAEIEVLLNNAPGIQQAVVVAKEYQGSNKRLIAYLTTNQTEDTAAIKHYIAEKVPDYMVPSAFIWVKDFPKTSSGKVDRNALPNPVLQRPESYILYKAPVTLTQKRLSVLWAGMLQMDRVGVDDNFFDLGGNSLLAINTATQLRAQFNIALPVTKIYQYPTINGISEYLEGTSEQQLRVSSKRSNTENGDIAVIAMAGKWPGAGNVQEFWEILKNGQETVSFFTVDELDLNIPAELKSNPAYVKARGIIDDAAAFDAGFFNIAPRMAEMMDPQQRVFLEIAWEALEAAGYPPQNHAGLIGVYAGSNNNTYYYNNVLTNPQTVEQAGAFQVMTLNEKDYIATRTAYELNLKGPAVSVYSACSTSLLAIAQAVDALRDGQCDMALAGGVTISSPLKSGHLYNEGAMLSKDGHCRPFDAEASGTTFSDGAGVVLLKSLAAAQQDGDTIYAVIKGKGVNNDGHSKGSFSAPSVSGQAGAIASALQDAGVDAKTISYVEAHGTATPLGDPIEIDGLKLAFNTTEKQYCAIGSVKSNMGHLTAASGVTGFIKTALSLHHQQLVPSLFYKQPNPAIDFADSPFYVNTTLKTWDVEGSRTAGVSSFGVGGTNVHVVVQEYQNAVPESGGARPVQLITWSAKSPNSVTKYAEKLAAYPINNLADAAYTLQTSRTEFNSRRFEVAGSLGELQEKLRDTNSLRQKTLKEKATEVVFLFPGQGSQYAGMGEDLYQHEPVFKQAVDECAAIIKQQTGTDIIAIIYGDESKEKLSQTLYIQPAIFVIEYALARLWMSWGIRPTAFLGHSLGEFVAAHLSGIMNMEDMLHLITARAQMIHDLPGGKMLAARATVQQLQGLLPKELSIAAKNNPNLTVISGTTEAVDTFAKTLSEHNIPSMPLNTSHAMHSAMVEGIMEPYKGLFANIKLSPPRIPIVSSLTGKWLSEAEATNPDYWARQMREPVEFVEAIKTANDEPNRVLLECGPGNILANLAKNQPDRNKEQAILPGLVESTASDDYTMLNTLGQLWLNGIEPDWQAFYAGQKRVKVSLPSYAFDHQDYWLAPGKTLNTSANAASLALPISQPIAPVINAPKMSRKELLSSKVREIFEAASGIGMDQVPANMSFAEAGFDSLLLTQIALNLKKEFGIPVTFRKLYEEYENVDRLAAFLDANLPASAYQSAPVAPPVNYGDQSPLGLIAQQMQILSQQIASLQNGNGAAYPQAIPAADPKAQFKLDNDFTPEELVEIKKPFGATARIESKHSTELSDQQKQFIADLTKNYNQKTQGSKNYTQQYREGMADPRVVSGFRPTTKELVYPLVVNKSKGSRVWDVDGNEYIDALNGFGSNFLGYNPDFLKKVFTQQIEDGYEIGPQHILAGDVCNLINEFTGFERSALCNTGSEAVLGAMRMARTVNGKSLIVAFAGSYHGIIDEVIVRGSKKLKTVPAAPGILPENVQNMLILDYGTDESLAIIKQRAHEIAAVLVEPVQSRRPEFQPVEFLKELRQVTKEGEVALIFDEVITGFRMHPGGAQALFGIKADIGTYGKVIGGGMPIGVIAGIPLYMDALDGGGKWQYGDASVPEAGVTYFAGTFVRHPLALAGSKAVLTYLKEQGPALQERLTALATNLVDRLNAICQQHQLPVYIAQFGSLWKIKFKYEMAYGELLFTLMRLKGIHIWDIFPCFLTAAHTQAEVDTIVAKFAESVDDMIAGGFFNTQHPPTHPDENKLNAFNKAPVAGAKLGRDKDGNPAWFIPDDKNPGKYLQIQPN